MKLAWAAPAAAAQTRPTRLNKISGFVWNLWKTGAQGERPGRVERAGNPPVELAESHWGGLFGFGFWGCLYSVMFSGFLLGGGARVVDGRRFGGRVAARFLLVQRTHRRMERGGEWIDGGRGELSWEG